MSNVLVCCNLSPRDAATVVRKLLRWLTDFSSGPNYVDGSHITLSPPNKAGKCVLCFSWNYLRARSDNRPDVWNAVPMSLAPLMIPWTRIRVDNNVYDCLDGRIPTFDAIIALDRDKDLARKEDLARKGSAPPPVWAGHLTPVWDGW